MKNAFYLHHLILSLSVTLTQVLDLIFVPIKLEVQSIMFDKQTTNILRHASKITTAYLIKHASITLLFIYLLAATNRNTLIQQEVTWDTKQRRDQWLYFLNKICFLLTRLVSTYLSVLFCNACLPLSIFDFWSFSKVASQPSLILTKCF